jgi:hypothetical protein
MSSQAIHLNQPIRVVIAMEKESPASPAEKPEPDTLDTIKKVAAYSMVVIGLLCVLGAFGLLSGCAMGLFAIETSTAHTLFLCGLYATIGGFSLQNSGYRSNVTLFPVSFKLDPH